MRSHMLILTLTTALGLSSTGCIKKVLVDGQIESTRNAASSADTIGDYDVGRIAAQFGAPAGAVPRFPSVGGWQVGAGTPGRG